MKTETKAILREIGKDIGRAGLLASAGLAYVVCKVSYPILGNLSRKVQGRIAEMVGSECYDAGIASATSAITNVALYPAIFYKVGVSIRDSLLWGLPIAGVEMAARNIMLNIKRDSLEKDHYLNYSNKLIAQEYSSEARAIGSLPGKIISLPFEAGISVYDKARSYLKDVKRRVKEQV